MLRRDVLYESKREGHAKSFNCLCVSTSQLYVGLGNGQIISIDKKSGRVGSFPLYVVSVLRTFEFDSSGYAIPNCKVIAGGRDGAFNWYDLRSGRFERKSEAHSKCVFQLIRDEIDDEMYVCGV